MDCTFLLIHQLRWFLAMIFLLFVIGLSSVQAHLGDVTHAMPKEEREMLKEEARDMFYHAYRAYMENAYPADELMPLTCCGRWRGTEPSRGDIDDTLGNFSLTLVDTLDTLVIMGDLKEFEHAVKLVARDVSFDSDIVVSVFETNIRILGGLLSGHILAEYFQQRAGIMSWYRSELLDLARDVGYRLLPAFNTTTGIPHARINLRYGLKSQKLESSRETCTACAGTMILEMAALSRLTGESIFEEKAHRAMDVLWRMRHRSSDLMGTVLNVHSGDWVRRDSGVGAGIDSYYEYCLKAYILLGDERYLGRFNRHYSAVMKYISQGPMLLDVHMHRPHTNSRNFMDALLAFWPGLQVLKGDIKPAVETHEMLYQVMQRHNFIPEAFTTDFQVHWGQHPLRPEFLESTYFLYRATGDPYYLEVGRNVLRSLQKYARVPCGYAAVKDVRTGVHEDRMDSFVLAETFKYLYLLFADPSDLVLDLDEFLFTTEAHLLPLSLARLSNLTVVDPIGRKRVSEETPEGIFSSKESDHGIWDEDVENARSCPNTLHLFPESVRRPLRNMVDGICPKNSIRRKLRASEYQAGNQDHAKIIGDMGITVLTLPDGRVQLVHNLASARSAVDGEEGILFMQEMVELSKMQAQQPETSPQAVIFNSRWAAMQAEGSQSAKISKDGEIVLSAGPAHFGLDLKGDQKVTARIGVAEPLRVCGDLENPERLHGRIAVVERGDCMFVEKARRVQAAGAVGAIVVDNTPGTSATSSPMFAMSGDGQDDVTIPVVFLFYSDATILLHAVSHSPSIQVTLASSSSSMASKGKASEAKKVQVEQSAHEITLEQLKESVHNFLRKKSSTQAFVGVPEVTPVDTADFHASVEQVGDQELIRITRKDSADSTSASDSKTKLSLTDTSIELVASEEILRQVLRKAISDCEGKMDSVADVAQQLLKAYIEPTANPEETKEGVKPKPFMASDVLLCLSAIENVALVASKEKLAKPSLSPPTSTSSENNDKHTSVFFQISENLRRRALLDSLVEVKVEKPESVSSKVEDECPEEGENAEDESGKSDVLVEAVPAERCPLKDRGSDSLVSDLNEGRTCESDDVENDKNVSSESGGVEVGVVKPEPRDEL